MLPLCLKRYGATHCDRLCERQALRRTIENSRECSTNIWCSTVQGLTSERHRCVSPACAWPLARGSWSPTHPPGRVPAVLHITRGRVGTSGGRMAYIPRSRLRTLPFTIVLGMRRVVQRRSREVDTPKSPSPSCSSMGKPTEKLSTIFWRTYVSHPLKLLVLVPPKNGSRTLGFRNAVGMQVRVPSPSSKRDMSLVINPCSNAFASTPLLHVCARAVGRSHRYLKRVKAYRGRNPSKRSPYNDR